MTSPKAECPCLASKSVVLKVTCSNLAKSLGGWGGESGLQLHSEHFFLTFRLRVALNKNKPTRKATYLQPSQRSA